MSGSLKSCRAASAASSAFSPMPRLVALSPARCVTFVYFGAGTVEAWAGQLRQLIQAAAGLGDHCGAPAKCKDRDRFIGD
jgi:hypothetical protein